MNPDRETVRKIVQRETIRLMCEAYGLCFTPIAISNRHIHVSAAHVAALFGNGYRLKSVRNLSQPGQFVCEEKVTLVGPKGSLKGVRVLGPERKATQVEISKTDSYLLGVKPFVRMSGDLDNTPGIMIVGPAGEIPLTGGVIISARHLHLSSEETELFGLRNGDVVRIMKSGERELVFGNVIVRAGTGHAMEVHIDTDEGNAGGISSGELVLIEKQG